MIIADACTYKGYVLSTKHVHKYCALFTHKTVERENRILMKILCLMIGHIYVLNTDTVCRYKIVT